MEYFQENLAIRKTKKWDVGNTVTIVDWISTSNLNILILDAYLLHLRKILNVNTLWSLVISSITSTISVTQFTINDATQPVLSFWIKVIIFISSIFTSLITGYIKVQKIQETIETLEEHKSKWMTFMYFLLSEIQVGINFRKSATDLINSKKEEFNNINSKQFMIPKTVRLKVSKFLTASAIDSMKEIKTSCYQKFCEWSLCCVKDNFEIKTIKLTKKKLSLYYSINRELKKELLELLLYFPDIVEEINFNEDTDMFQYEINNKYFEKEKNVAVKFSDENNSQERKSKKNSRFTASRAYVSSSATVFSQQPQPATSFVTYSEPAIMTTTPPKIVDITAEDLKSNRERKQRLLETVIAITDINLIKAYLEDYKMMILSIEKELLVINPRNTPNLNVLMTEDLQFYQEIVRMFEMKLKELN